MSYVWYIYSLDEKLKISQIKSWEYENNLDISKISQYISENNIKILSQDELYHDKFLSIPSKPYIIYAIGNLELLNNKIIWIVWPRQPSEYATKAVSQIISLLSNKKNIATISWLAEWIDDLVHNESINNTIPTIAVLGWWITHFITWSKKNLIQKIVNNWWLIISEFKLKQKPTPWSFPQRNRIVAWLSDIIVLPEASENSWSLITANFWLDMKKPVYIIPNSINSEKSKWSNKLLNHIWTKAMFNIPERVNENFEEENNINSIKKTLNHQKITKEQTIINDENINQTQKNILLSIIKWYDAIDKILNNNKWINYNELISQITILEIEWYISSSIPWKFECK